MQSSAMINSLTRLPPYRNLRPWVGLCAFKTDVFLFRIVFTCLKRRIEPSGPPHVVLHKASVFNSRVLLLWKPHRLKVNSWHFYQLSLLPPSHTASMLFEGIRTLRLQCCLRPLLHKHAADWKCKSGVAFYIKHTFVFSPITRRHNGGEFLRFPL